MTTPPKDFLDWLGISNAPNWPVARALGPLFAILLAVLFVIALLAGFAMLGRTISGGFDTAAGNLGAGALVVALLGAPFLIWSTVIKHKALGFQKEGHITDRINTAVEMLGTEKTIIREGESETVANIEVRIGALLSLERIAQDSVTYDKGRDHVRVMEILCAYIRENAPATGPNSKVKDFPFPEWESLADDASDAAKEIQEMWRKARFGEGFDANARQWANSLRPPGEDIRIGLKIIGRRSKEQKEIEACWGLPVGIIARNLTDRTFKPLEDRRRSEPYGQQVLDQFKEDLDRWKASCSADQGYNPDLRGTNLQRAELTGLDLSGVILRNARMEGANLVEANLVRADLCSTKMAGATLCGAKMHGALLIGANMEAAWFRGAKMQGAAPMDVHAEASDFTNTRLQASDFSGSYLDAAIFQNARLQAATLVVARLGSANLKGACMEGSNLVGARLERAHLGQADLNGLQINHSTLLNLAIFHASKARMANFREAVLSNAQIESMFCDASVIIPNTLTRPKHWPDWELPDEGPNAFYTQYALWLENPDTYTPPPKPTPP